MKQVRHDKIEKILHRRAAEFVRDEASPSSLITITRAELNPAGKDAVIYFTTLPSSAEEAALSFLERKAPELKHILIKESRIGIVPHIRFKIDVGERHRERLDELSREA